VLYADQSQALGHRLAELGALGHTKQPLLRIIRTDCIECCGGSEAEVPPLPHAPLSVLALSDGKSVPPAGATKDVTKFKEKAQSRIVEALDNAVLEAMKEIKAASLAIHTDAERKKTNAPLT
jgi:hypothetical protein